MASTSFIIDLRAPSDKLAGDLGRAVRLVEGFSNSLKTVGATAAGFAAAQIGLASLGAAFETAKAAIIDFNTTLDKAQLSFKFLLGGADEARAHIAELSEIAKDSPFPTKDFLDASRILQGLGANAAAIPGVLTQIANAAVRAEVPLTAATEAIGRFLSNISAGGGAVGQGARQLQSQGLISAEMKKSLTDMEAQGASAQEIIRTFLTDLKKFDGAAKEAANSWEGLIVNIKGALGDAAGIAFRPFFLMFEQLGRAFLKAINTDDAKASMLEFGLFMFNTTEKLVTSLIGLWEPLTEMFRGFVDFGRQFSTLIQHQAAAQEALKRGMSFKDFVFSGPKDIQDFLDANPVLGPINQNSLKEKTKAAFAGVREEFEKGMASLKAAGTAAGGGGDLFDNLGPTAEQNQKLEEARRIFESLSPDIDETGRKLIQLRTQFDALAKGAGENTAAIKAFGELSLQVAEQVGRTKSIENFTDTLDALKPGVDGVIQKLESLAVTVKKLARDEPEGFLRNAVKVLGGEVERSIVQFELLKGKVADVQQQLDEMDAGEAAALQNELKINDAFKQRDNLVKDLAASLIAISIATKATRGTGLQGIGPTFGEQHASAITSNITSLSQVIANANRAMADLDPEGEAWQRLSDLIDETSLKINRLSFELQDVDRSNVGERLAADFDLIDKQAQAFGGAFDAVGARITATESAINTLIRQGVELTDAEIQGLIRALDALRQQAKIVEFVGSAIESSMTTASNTIIDAFFAGETAAIKWGDVVTAVLRDITKELFKVFVVQTLVNAARGALGGLGGGGGGEIGGLDAGGIVTRPGIFALAEKGRPEAVIPLDQLRMGGGGGGDVTVNIHPPAGTESRAQENTDGQGTRTIDVFITKVVERGLSQGTFDRSLGSSFGLTRQGARR